MHRRRKPDAWRHVRPGDIVSFSTKSPRCPSSTYVVRVEGDPEYGVTLVGSEGPIHEHKSYNLRLDQRGLTLQMREDNVLDHSLMWRANMTFDWRGRRAPVITIEGPGFQRVWFLWNSPTQSFDADTELQLHVWTPPDLELLSAGLTHQLILRDGELVVPERGHPVQNTFGEDSKAAGVPAPFEELFEKGPRVRAQLTAVARWISEHRFELVDPATLKEAAIR